VTLFTPGAVLSVRFIARQYHRDEKDPGEDKEEMNSDQGLDETTTNGYGSANDPAADVDVDKEKEEDEDANDEYTPGQVDWIIVTSHADNTIRFRSAKVSHRCTVYRSITIAFCGVRRWKYITNNKVSY